MWMANLVPTAVKPKFDDEIGLYYEVKVDGNTEFLNRWEVFHLKGLAVQQHRALNLLSLMRNELGLALASKLYLSKFFERGGHHGGILMVPPGVEKGARENLEKGVHKRADPKSWFKTMILRDGVTWQASTVDPKSAEMHELTDDEARAVCHFFNMPPYKIGLRDSESYNSAEMAMLNYIKGSLLHTCKRIQGEAMMKLLTHRNRRARSHKFEHNFSNLLEPDVKTLNEVLAIQRQNEIINANDWRAKIKLPLRADEKATEYVNPNTKSNKNDGETSADSDGSGSGSSTSESSQASNGRMGAAIVRVMDESILRACRRICTVAKNKSRKPNELLQWCDNCGSEHSCVVAEEIQSAVEVAFDEKKSRVVVMASERWLMDRITSGLSVYLESPHKPADLSTNVDQFCRQLLDEVCQSWREEIIDAA